MPDECLPRCPRCHTRKVRESGPKNFYCTECRMEFDGSGDDGEIGYGSPERFAVRNENHARSQRNRLLGKRPAGKLKGGLAR
jgi:ribosomal protein L37AE/L43A